MDSAKKEKAVFTVALFAAVITFASNVKGLSSIVIHFSSGDIDLLGMLGMMIFILGISIYFFALDYAIGGLWKKYLRFLSIILQGFADFTFFFAVFLPVFTFLLWFLDRHRVKEVAHRWYGLTFSLDALMLAIFALILVTRSVLKGIEESNEKAGEA
jgi:hypothetical protein